MSSFTLSFIRLVAVWLFVSTVGMAQEASHLKVQPDRLLKARETERQAMATHDTLLLAEAWYLYGKTYVFSGDYRASQGYFLKSLQLLEPRGDSENLSRIYVRISENEGRLGRRNEALHYATLALGVAQRIGSDKAQIRAYGAMGRVRESLWNGQLRGSQAAFDSILSCYKHEERLCFKLKDTLGLAEASVELGTLLSRVNDPQAIRYLKKSLSLFTLKHKDRLQVGVLIHLAEAYLKIGKTTLAFEKLSEAHSLFSTNKVDEYDTQLEMERVYVRYYQSVGGWQEALNHLLKANELEKSQLLSDRDGTISRLNIAYETKKKEALLNAQKNELALRTENLHTQQRFTMATSALFIMAGGMSLIFFRLSRKNQRISRRNEELLKEQNHRVKNNLQVVSSLLSLQSKRLTDKVAKKAVEESRLRVQSMVILHQQLYNGDHLAEIDLNDYIRELTNSALHAFGYGFVETQFDLDPVYLLADKAIPVGLIINELITNACKYAFADNDEPLLQISCRREGRQLTLTVTDNGPGLEAPVPVNAGIADTTTYKSSVTYSKSFGMTLIQAQVDQLNGTFQFSTSTAPEAKGTVCIVQFTS